MTDKQIIKNGIDVSGCDFYDKNKKYCLTLKMNPTGFKNPSCFSGDFQKCIQDSKTCPNTFCDNNPNCHYKKWKRKEQKCKELNKYIKHLHNLCGNETDKQYKYKQALTEIKEMCKQKLPAGLSASSCYESFEAFTGYILQKCEVLDE